MIDQGITTRLAHPSDIVAITRLVERHARAGEILPRSEEAIRESLSNWIVAINGMGVVACGSLLPYSLELAEIRSLVVDDAFQRNGLGSKVVEALILKARQNKYQSLFALTRAVPFFTHLGFARTDKTIFPQKIWRDCSQCPIQNNCDEQAVTLELFPIHSVSHQPASHNQEGPNDPT